MNRRLLFAVFLAFTVVSGSVAKASPITYYVAGTFDFAYNAYAPYLNTRWTGQILYDPAWPLGSSSIYEAGYTMPAGAITLSLVDANVVSTGGSWAIGNYPVTGAYSEYMYLGTGVIVTPTSGTPPVAPLLGINLIDGRCGTDVLSSTALPATLPPLGSLCNPFIHYGESYYPGTNWAEGWIDCLSSEPGVCGGGSSVPETGGFLMAVTGLLWLKMLRRHWR